MMTREQKINLLSEIKPTVGNIVHTYDMGVQFTVMDSSGIWVELGNFPDFPLYRFDGINNRIACEVVQKASKSNSFWECVSGTSLVAIESVFNDYDEIAKKLHGQETRFIDISSVKAEIIECIEQRGDNSLYGFINLVPVCNFYEIRFFASYDGIEHFLMDKFQNLNTWDSVDDEVLDEACALLDEQGEGLVFYTPESPMECAQ